MQPLVIFVATLVFIGFKLTVAESAAEDCLAVKHGQTTAPDGVYEVQSPDSGEKLKVYCDMTTDGGGWTVFQKRLDGSTDFYRTFEEYENGFGHTNAEFWMGLKRIHDMTTRHTTELRVDVTAADGTRMHDTYQGFYLSPGSEYTLHVGKWDSTIGGDGGRLVYNSGSRFSAKNKDVDGASDMDCAKDRHAGWWYAGCTNMNLNGQYVTPGTKSEYGYGGGGMVYANFKHEESLKSTKMMFRRKQ